LWLKFIKIYLPMPVSLSHNYVYGSSLGLTYVLQLLTGLILTLHYQGSFDGLIIYLREVVDGQMIRYFHANGASLFLGLMFLHVARGLYYGSCNKKSLWVSGVILLLLSMGVAFLGYVLPYGQMSYWGATVIINLISVISMTAVIWIWGGYVVSKYTLTRFYTLHFLLPLVLAVLILGHLHALHKTGGSSLSYSPNKLSFFPFYSVKDAMIWAVIAFVFVNIALIYPNLLGDAENYIAANPMVTPAHIKPEWYFLFAYAILRCIPNKALGVLALVLAVAVPLIHVLGFGGRHSFPMALMAVTFSLLTVVGGMVIVKHYSLMARLLTVVYFGVVVFMS